MPWNRHILLSDQRVVRVASPAKPIVITFGPYEFNPHSGELRKEGMHVRLEGQPLAILQILLDRPGELITREELHCSWQISVVTLRFDSNDISHYKVRTVTTGPIVLSARFEQLS